MAIYIFENMTQAQATGLTSSDAIVFNDSAVRPLDVTVTPGDALSLATSLTVAGKTLSFPADALSQITIQFGDQSSLVLGSGAADDGVTGVDLDKTTSTNNLVVYGLGGDDDIVGGAGHDYVFGGVGGDNINGGNGNDHLYGNSNVSVVGATDGADVINGGVGADYIQGNTGNDSLDGGVGDDRIYGGQGDDSVVGGDGNDYVQGNLGNDQIDGGLGNDVLRGGQGNDQIVGGDGNDIIYGDLGNDVLTGGVGLDVLFGGDGNDVFRFAAGDAANTQVGNTGALANVVDIIADFGAGDTIDLAGVTPFVAGTPAIPGSPAVPAVPDDLDTPDVDESQPAIPEVEEVPAVPDTPAVVAALLTDSSGTSFGTLLAAQNYAQQLINAYYSVSTNDDHAVAALNFGGNTYLFSHEASAGIGAIDTVIQVANIAPTALSADIFV